MNRRKFVTGTALSTASLALPAGILNFSMKNKSKPFAEDPITASQITQNTASAYNLMKEVKKYRKMDAHIHVYLFNGPPESNIELTVRSAHTHPGPGS